jgi:Cu(I)/Ag(I) efflux system membrane fusion protein
MKIKDLPILICCSLLLLLPSRGSLAVEAAATQAAAAEAAADQGSAAEQAEAPTVEIPVEKQQQIGVKTISLALRPMQAEIRTVGRIDYDERGLASINTKFEGWIEKLFVNVTGSEVKKGQPLAEIYSPELYATQLEYINALHMAGGGEKTNPDADDSLRAMLDRDSRSMVEAARQRLRLWDISDAQIRTITATGKPIRTMVIQSPVNGTVIVKNAVQGMRVMPGDKMFDIADLSKVWVVADLYESQMARVSVGQEVSISFDNLPGWRIASTIDFISPVLAGETRTVRVRCTLPNPDGRLKPQMFATLEIRIPLGQRLAVPDDAVIDTGTRKIVYVDQGEGLFEPREVRTGVKIGGLTEIVQGVKVGEKVAMTANFLIDSEAQLKGVAPLPNP